jgi:hypothetical protein
MLSDSLFQCIDNLLEAVKEYEYSDQYKGKLLVAIRKLNEIRDDLDKDGEGDLLKKNKEESKRIVKQMYRNAVKKRDMSAVDYYQDLS